MRKLILMLCAVLACAPAVQAQEDLEVIVVTGRRPGPPLWRVTNGDNTLWILPLVSAVPKNMEWDDERVAALIADADAAIDVPNVSYDVPKRVLLNPINWVRAVRMFKRLAANPDGQTLADVLPTGLHERFAALKSEYFPRDDKIDKLRPSFALDEISGYVRDGETLTGTSDIERRVDRHIRRNRDIVRMDMDLVHMLDGNYRELSERVEDIVNGMQGETEIACFDLTLSVFEQHLDDIKAMANAWANGSAAELEDFAQSDSLDNPCNALQANSSEGTLLLDMQRESRARWLDAAQGALETHASTFAMLPLAQIIGTNSLVAELASRGFMVRDPR
jgi:hypothetical protein